MATATVETRKTNTKQPQPVHGVARWIGGTATQGQLDSGDAILQFTVAGKEPTFYFVRELKDGDGDRAGFQLVKIDALDKTETYDIDLYGSGNVWTCDCPDAVYANRPGGCKHVCGLRAALTAA